MYLFKYMCSVPGTRINRSIFLDYRISGLFIFREIIHNNQLGEI